MPQSIYSRLKNYLCFHIFQGLSSSNHDHQIFISILGKKEDGFNKENLCSEAVEEFPLSSFIVVDFVEEKMMKKGAGHCCKNEMLSKINKRVQAAG